MSALTRALPPAAAAAQMTLRAIGNLTRCDENIMRAVGYGVIRGMVDGMTKHADDPTVLQLCADVIGNMASVDDKKVPKEEGVRIMTECAQKRPASMLVPRPPPAPRKTMLPGASPAALLGGAGAAPPGPPPAGKPSAPKPPPPEASAAMVLNVLSAARNLKEAVCTILYDDGGAGALLAAMTKHIRNPDLAGSCLRALHYIGASPALVGRMVTDLKVRPRAEGGPLSNSGTHTPRAPRPHLAQLVDNVVFIMRSIDYRPDVLRRGARVLGLVVGTESRSRTPDGRDVVTFPLRDRVLEAGAPQVLLGAIETHKTERELCISCYSVLAMSRSAAVVTAVQEMQAVDTAVAVLRANAADHEYVGVLLELLWGWAAEQDLAVIISSRA